MESSRIIAITGGIGAGKSVVASILRHAGFGVYDCDMRAKLLMNTSPAIRQALVGRFGPEVYSENGDLDRAALSSIIFNDKDALAFVNSVVHPAVRDDIVQWSVQQDKAPAFVETAILQESGLDAMVDEVWIVTAPVEVRIERVIKRNATTRERVLERIHSQRDQFTGINKKIVEIANDGIVPLLPQVMRAVNLT